MDTIQVWYLFHSGFAVKVNSYLLVFDYYLDEPDGKSRSLSSGVINPDEIKDLDVLVFSSHKHPDHFNPTILTWQGQIGKLRYFLSYDIPKRFSEGHVILKPGVTYQTEDGIKISTLKSTDAGVAFLLELEGLTIYHAGDLNWWHWDEETKAKNNDMAARYKHEMARLSGKKIDIAFLTADPRQEDAALWGMAYFMENIGAAYAFPMHFGHDFAIMTAIDCAKKQKTFLSPVHNIERRGQAFILPCK